MAAYNALDSYRSVQVNSSTKVTDVEVVTVQTVPTGIVYTYAVPLDLWTSDGAVNLFTLTSEWMETLVTSHHVVGGSPSQDFDVNNLLADFVDLVVEYDQGPPTSAPLRGTVSAPIVACILAAEFGDSTDQAGVFTDPIVAIDAEYARLEALAAG